MLIDEIAERIEKDKLLHFTFSMIAMRLFLAVVSKSFFSCFLTAILVLSVGVLKELYDKKRGQKFDKNDLIADLFGVLFGLI